MGLDAALSQRKTDRSNMQMETHAHTYMHACTAYIDQTATINNLLSVQLEPSKWQLFGEKIEILETKNKSVSASSPFSVATSEKDTSKKLHSLEKRKV